MAMGRYRSRPRGRHGGFAAGAGRCTKSKPERALFLPHEFSWQFPFLIVVIVLKWNLYLVFIMKKIMARFCL